MAMTVDELDQAWQAFVTSLQHMTKVSQAERAKPVSEPLVTEFNRLHRETAAVLPKIAHTLPAELTWERHGTNPTPMANVNYVDVHVFAEEILNQIRLANPGAGVVGGFTG